MAVRFLIPHLCSHTGEIGKSRIPSFKGILELENPPMKNHKIDIYIHPNPEIRSFLTTQDVFPPRVEVFCPPLSDKDAPRLHALGIIGAQIIKDILSLPGIREVRIKPKEVRIIKVLSIDWEDIQERIVTSLTRALRKRQLKLVRGRSNGKHQSPPPPGRDR